MENLDKEYLELLFNKISGDCYNHSEAINISPDFYDMLPDKFASKSLGKILKDDKIKDCLTLYELMFVRSVKGSEIVFGNLDKVKLEGTNDTYNHVWINLGSFVIDFKTRFVYYKDAFYKSFGAQENVSFKHQTLIDADKFAKLVNEAVKNKPELHSYAKKVISSNDQYTENHYEI